MMQQYFRIKQEHPEEVIFFRMGDFFEMFHEDAITAHEVLGITLTKRNHGKGKSSQVPLAGFPHHQLETYLAKMTRAGKRVVVVEQVEDPKKAQGLVKRDIVRIVTAGTNFSDEALEGGQNQYLASIYFEKKTVGLALCDVTTGEFHAATMLESDVQEMLELLKPAELLYADEQRDYAREIAPQGTMLTAIADWFFQDDFARETLTTHFSVQSLKGFGIDNEHLSVAAAGAALHYVRDNLRTNPEHFKSISRLPTDKFLVLDGATRRNLEIFEPAWGADRRSTLRYHIDRTVTPFGKRLFMQRLIRPLVDKAQIESRYDAVAEMFTNVQLRDSLRDQLKSLGDIERLTAKLAAKRGTPRDAGALRDTLKRLPEIINSLSVVKSGVLLSIYNQLDDMEDLADFLEIALVDEPPPNMLHGTGIREGYHEQLDEIRKIASGGKQFILEREMQEKEATGINSLSIGFNKPFGYYIEVSKANSSKVPEHYIRKQTLVNAERYITPELKVWEEKVLTAEEEALEIEKGLFEEIRYKIISQSARIQKNAHLLAQVDNYAANAVLAQHKRYSRPIIRDDDRLILQRSRHPVVEDLLPEGETFVANDIDLDGETRQLALVTGPNMGGKSTYLRQVGLVVLMAHAGLYVPAEKAEIPLTDRIFTRVGASDNLAAGESTFLVEMHEAANILHNATHRSLILLDEIGRGTSTFDGLSLAWAIAEYLHDYPGGAKPKTLFATHYHELTELEGALARVINLHVEVKEWGEKVVFLRKVVPGRSGASYGIQVARLAGLPLPVIERAKEVLSALESSSISEDDLPRLAKGAKLPKIPLKEDPLQLTLFTVEEREVRDALDKIDLNNTTPLEALRILAEWKEKYSKIQDEED